MGSGASHADASKLLRRRALPGSFSSVCVVAVCWPDLAAGDC